MLVRFFIGLILITTLTSDGTLMLPDFLSSYMYFTQGPASVQGESAGLPSIGEKTLPTREGMLRAVALSPCGFFSNADVYDSKVKYKEGVDNALPQYNGIVYAESYQCLFTQFILVTDRHILTVQSDLSPPVC